MSDIDVEALLVMLEEIEKNPNAFSHGALVGACIRAKAVIDDLQETLDTHRSYGEDRRFD